jgi:carbonic anhydrase
MLLPLLRKDIHNLPVDLFGTRADLTTAHSEVQGPVALMVACSEMGGAPDQASIFGPDDLVFLQNFGNFTPHSETGQNPGTETVLWALEERRVRNIIVCGHQKCGVFRHLLSTEQEPPYLAVMRQHFAPTQRIIEGYYSDQGDEVVASVIPRENVLTQLENMLSYPLVADQVRRGRLRFHACILNDPAGRVLIYNAEKGQFE